MTPRNDHAGDDFAKDNLKRVPWHSAITEVRQDELITHGVNQTEIIENFSFEEMVFLLLAGRRPNAVEADLLRAVILAQISHGITGQSTLAAMMAADCRSSFLSALIAGFSVGSGVYHQGGLQAAMQALQQLQELDAATLNEEIRARLSRGERIIGYGHRFHKQDPRAIKLFAIADKHKFVGSFINLSRSIEAILHQEKGISINIEGAIGAILLDLAISPAVAHLIVVLGRSPMYAAVYLERLQQRSDPFPRVEVADLLPRP